jgi:hypothetical protein
MDYFGKLYASHVDRASAATSQGAKRGTNQLLHSAHKSGRPLLPELRLTPRADIYTPTGLISSLECQKKTTPGMSRFRSAQNISHSLVFVHI